MTPLKIKICCISSKEEAEIAIREGATTIGLVGHMPSGPGVISDPLIKEISAAVPDFIDTFLLTSETTVTGIVTHYERTQTRSIQLVDYPNRSVYHLLKKRLPQVKIIQVVHVIDDSSVVFAKEIENEVDALLLDSGNTLLKTKQLGGTGRTHDWSLSQKIVKHSTKPVYLAGGLNSANIAEAIQIVKPYGVDICSGVRTEDRLDVLKLKAFFKSLHQMHSKTD